MFRLWWRLLVVLLGLWLPVILGGLAQRQPLSAVQAGLGLCAAPCWAGIEPGRTAVEAVPEVVQTALPNTPVILNPYQRLIRYTVEIPELRIQGAISAQGSTVSSIRLNMEQPLWPLLLLLDTPRCIEWLERHPTLNIYWEINSVYVMSSLYSSPVNAQLLIHSLAVWQPGAEAPCDRFGQVQPWPGYARLARLKR
jgi:hypothetical protein